MPLLDFGVCVTFCTAPTTKTLAVGRCSTLTAALALTDPPHRAPTPLSVPRHPQQHLYPSGAASLPLVSAVPNFGVPAPYGPLPTTTPADC